MSASVAYVFPGANPRRSFSGQGTGTVQRRPAVDRVLRWLRVFPAIALLALSLVGTGAKPVLAAEPTLKLKAFFSGTVAGTGPTTAVLNGIAQGTGLGNNVGYVGNVAGITPIPGGGFTDTLTETLTLPNGDTLTILCLQIAEPIGPNVFLGTDRWTVIGGTGGMAGATGEGSGFTQIDLAAGTYTKALNGTVQRQRGN